ncbi:MAG: hypothetical protein ACHQRM_09445 [Bacteroidia bacterium]
MMNTINQEIIGNMATVYMKDGSIKNGRILSFRTEVEELVALEFETKPAHDPYARVRLMELTEFLDTTAIEAIDPYCK